eukprot:4906480-Amphidinium_carterae.1
MSTVDILPSPCLRDKPQVEAMLVVPGCLPPFAHDKEGSISCSDGTCGCQAVTSTSSFKGP